MRALNTIANPIKENDDSIIEQVLDGNQKALEQLILRHQAWIYNIVLRMVNDHQDAEDITQEILIKMITKLSSFQGKCRFRTWLYRIVVNHVMNVSKKSLDKKSFRRYSEQIDMTPDSDFPDDENLLADKRLIVEEIKIFCLMGMLMCLNQRQRLVFILGDIFGLSSKESSEILEITNDNYRKILSRARRKVYIFLKEKCTWIKPGNPCSCERKAGALIEGKIIDPKNLKYASLINTTSERTTAKERCAELNIFIKNRCRNLFREHGLFHSPDFVTHFRQLVNSNEFKEILNIAD